MNIDFETKNLIFCFSCVWWIDSFIFEYKNFNIVFLWRKNWPKNFNVNYSSFKNTIYELNNKSVSFRMCAADDSEIIYPKLTCILCTTITYLFCLSFSVVLFVHCRVSSSCFVGSYTYIPEIAGGILSGGLPIVVSAVLIPRMGVFLETPCEYFTCCWRISLLYS